MAKKPPSTKMLVLLLVGVLALALLLYPCLCHRQEARTVLVPATAPVLGAAMGPATIMVRESGEQFSQVGILSKGGDSDILPLLGRRAGTGGSAKYEYFTRSGQDGLISRLPISFGGKDCTGEYGCEEISSGDEVYVDGKKELYETTIYDRQPRYVPLP